MHGPCECIQTGSGGGEYTCCLVISVSDIGFNGVKDKSLSFCHRLEIVSKISVKGNRRLRVRTLNNFIQPKIIKECELLLILDV